MRYIALGSSTTPKARFFLNIPRPVTEGTPDADDVAVVRFPSGAPELLVDEFYPTEIKPMRLNPPAATRGHPV
ncbi:MAG: hypothetical protein CM15mP74_05210 [Halieaceae bacterium]|nr:MAG: hypothetical protein CM15mP74_05210 [Halieaceae bacterium]